MSGAGVVGSVGCRVCGVLCCDKKVLFNAGLDVGCWPVLTAAELSWLFWVRSVIGPCSIKLRTHLCMGDAFVMPVCLKKSCQESKSSVVIACFASCDRCAHSKNRSGCAVPILLSMSTSTWGGIGTISAILEDPRLDWGPDRACVGRFGQ